MTQETWILLGFAFFGAIVLWVRLRYGADLSNAIELLINDFGSKNALKLLLIILIYAGVGATIGMIAAEPNTYKQALAAGLGWSGLLGGIIPRTTKAART